MSDNSRVNNSLRSLEVQTTSSIEGPLRKKPKTGDQSSLRRSRRVHRRQPQPQSQSRQLKNRKADIDDRNASILDKKSIPSQVKNRGASNEYQTNNLLILAEATHIEALVEASIEAPVEAPVEANPENSLMLLADAAIEKLAHIPPCKVISHQSLDSSSLACDAIAEASILSNNDLGQRTLNKNQITLEKDSCYALTIDLPGRDIRIKIKPKTLLDKPNALESARITLSFIINCLAGDLQAVQATLDDQLTVGKLDLNQDFCLFEKGKNTKVMTIILHLLAKHCFLDPVYENNVTLSYQISFQILKAMFSNKKHFIDLTLRDERNSSMLHKAISSTSLSDSKKNTPESDRQCIITLILKYRFGTHDRIDIDAQSVNKITALHKIIKLDNNKITPILDVFLKNAPKSPKLIYEYEQCRTIVNHQGVHMVLVKVKIKNSILHELLSDIVKTEASIKNIFQTKGIDIEQYKTKSKQFSAAEKVIINKLPLLKKAFSQLLDSINSNNKDVLYYVEQGLNIQAYATRVLDSQQDKAILDKLESLYKEWGKSSEETVDQLHAS